MKNHPLILIACAIILVILVVHFLATFYFLYFAYPWLDIPMHFLGGAFTALLSIWFVGVRSVWGKVIKNQRLFFCVLALVISLVVGIGWELLEWFAGLVEANYLFDTVLDLVMDLAGALLAALFAISRFKDTIITNADSPQSSAPN
jgi:hypothetical protein